jgi:hypothetical protein
MSDDGSFIVSEAHPLPDDGFCHAFILLPRGFDGHAVLKNTKVLLAEFRARKLIQSNKK